MYTMQAYYDTLNEFKVQNPDFIGSKVIYAPLKNVSNKTIESYLKDIKSLYAAYPDFIAGFDLVGQEDLGPTLFEMIENLLKIPQDVNLFFHAGETNWNGLTDLNLV